MGEIFEGWVCDTCFSSWMGNDQSVCPYILKHPEYQRQMAEIVAKRIATGEKGQA